MINRLIRSMPETNMVIESIPESIAECSFARSGKYDKINKTIQDTLFDFIIV